MTTVRSHVAKCAPSSQLPSIGDKFHDLEFLTKTRVTDKSASGLGVVKPLFGDDGSFEHDIGEINTLDMRPDDARIHDNHDSILTRNRIVLARAGKPIWMYEDVGHYARALLAIVRGGR